MLEHWALSFESFIDELKFVDSRVVLFDEYDAICSNRTVSVRQNSLLFTSYIISKRNKRFKNTTKQ